MTATSVLKIAESCIMVFIGLLIFAISIYIFVREGSIFGAHFAINVLSCAALLISGGLSIHRALEDSAEERA